MLAKAAINPLKDFLVRAKSAFVLDRGFGVSDFELRRLGGRPGTCRGGLGEGVPGGDKERFRRQGADRGERGAGASI